MKKWWSWSVRGNWAVDSGSVRQKSENRYTRETNRKIIITGHTHLNWRKTEKWSRIRGKNIIIRGATTSLSGGKSIVALKGGETWIRSQIITRLNSSIAKSYRRVTSKWRTSRRIGKLKIIIRRIGRGRHYCSRETIDSRGWKQRVGWKRVRILRCKRVDVGINTEIGIITLTSQRNGWGEQRIEV